MLSFSLAKPEIMVKYWLTATWVIHFSIVTTRTVGMVEAAGEKRGIEGAPFVTMGENAVYLVKHYRKKRYSLEAKRAHVALLEIPETTYDSMGLEGVGIIRCRGVIMREPQNIHIAHAAAAESANRGISLRTVFTARWQFFFLYRHDYYTP
jgi:hypothetical protein